MIQSKWFEVSQFYFLRNESLDHQARQSANLWPLAIYMAAVLLLAAAMIGRSYVLGERHTGRAVGMKGDH